jgi:predicted helicase
MDLNQDIDHLTRQIAASLGLSYMASDEAGGEVCYANVAGLRPEYRQSFTHTNVLDYLHALSHNPGYHQQYAAFLKTDTGALPCPTDADTFWELVEIGSRLRHNHT